MRMQINRYSVDEGSSEGKSSSGNSEGKSFTLQLEAKVFVKVDATSKGRYGGCKPVMICTKVLSDTTAEKRASPVDLVVVLHVREGCNVPKNWKMLLAEAVRIAVENLNDEDRLAVLPVQSTLTTRKAYTAASQYLEGITSKISLLRALETAESILYGRQHEDKKIRAGHIIVISNSSDNIDSLLLWRFPSVHAFGFRDAHNARTMNTISSNRNCTYAVLDDEYGLITKAFLASINRITSPAAAMPSVEVKLNCEQKVALSGIDTPGVRYIISHDKKLGLVWPSAHLPGVATNFVAYLGNLHHPDDLLKLFKVHLKYSNVLDKEIGVQLVTKGVHGSKEVAAELVRIEAIRIVTSITYENDLEKLHAASSNLSQRWAQLKNSVYGAEAGADEHGLISHLCAEMEEMEIRLYNNYFWLEYMVTWQSHQRWQLPLPPQFMENSSSNDPLLRLGVFAKVDATNKDHQTGVVPVLVRVRAPEAGLAKVKRASVDLIVVLDVSYGAKEMKEKAETRLKMLNRAKEIQDDLINAKVESQNKRELDLESKKLKQRAKEMKKELRRVNIDTLRRLALVTKAMEVVAKKLSAKDRLAIVPVQSSVTAPPDGLLEMSNKGRRETSTKVQSVVDHVVSSLLTAWTDDGDKDEDEDVLPDRRPTCCKISHWKEQYKKAMMLLRNCLHIITSTCTMTSAENLDTASTPHTAAGVGVSSELRKALMDAVKILDDRQGEDRQGFIIVISDSDDDSICLKPLRIKYITHAFGFNDRHNTRAMYHIASSSNGIYDILNDGPYEITEAFTACINKITSIISLNTVVHIKCCPSSSVALSSIESGHFRYSIHSDRKSSSISVGALSAGMVKNFIVYVDNVREHEYDSLSRLLTVHVKWIHALNRVEQRLVECQVVAVCGAMDDGFKDVEENIARVDAVKVATETTDPNSRKIMSAEQLRWMRDKCPEFAESAGEERLARIIRHMEWMTTMEITDSDNYKNMVAEILPNMLSWVSYQRAREQVPSLPSVA